MAQQYKWQRVEGQTHNGAKDDLTKASTAITQGRPLTKDGSGFVIHATNSTTSPIIGVAMESKLSSDTSTAPILIDYFNRGSLWRVTVDTGTVSQATEGTKVDVATGGGIDVGTTTHGDTYVLRQGVYPGNTEVIVSVLNSPF